MSWLSLSEASKSQYDDEPNTQGFECEDRMVLAAPSPLTSLLYSEGNVLESGRIQK
jgi:hypothetical protein